MQVGPMRPVGNANVHMEMLPTSAVSEWVYSETRWPAPAMRGKIKNVNRKQPPDTGYHAKC